MRAEKVLIGSWDIPKKEKMWVWRKREVRCL